MIDEFILCQLRLPQSPGGACVRHVRLTWAWLCRTAPCDRSHLGSSIKIDDPRCALLIR